MDPFARPPPKDTIRVNISQKEVEAALKTEETALKKMREDVVRELQKVQYERVVYEKTMRTLERNRDLLLRKRKRDEEAANATGNTATATSGGKKAKPG